MASSKLAVGSPAWIAAEKENVQLLLGAEKEELVFPAQHEMEWLNEHMADVFANSHLDVANIFKTPGKLRGKTPRTARKRDVEPRIPLSDIFSSQPYEAPSPNKQAKSKIHFTVAEDQDQPQTQQPAKSQTDSGYHGSSQVDEEPRQRTPEIPVRSPLRTLKSPLEEHRETEDETHTNEGSFHSAKENQTVKLAQIQPDPVLQEEIKGATAEDMAMEGGDAPNFDDIGSPSDESTPDRVPVRKKSSMTFASLPAREPLKQSLGPRLSSHVAQKSEGHLKRQLSASLPGLSQSDNEDADVEMSDNDSHIEILGVDESQLELHAARQYSKASTQRLHEKINALGKIPVARPSKSIPSAVQVAAQRTPDQRDEIRNGPLPEDEEGILPPAEKAPPSATSNHFDAESADEYDSRAPELIAHEQRMARLSPSPVRIQPGRSHIKSASTVTLQSPAKAAMAPPSSPAKSISATYALAQSTTPQGSPSRFMDGVSASKSKLASIMKTAKGLFTSSASVSAAAKMETLTPAMTSLQSYKPAESCPDLNKTLPASPPKEVRKTRSSTEREKDAKRAQKDAEAMQKVESQLEKARADEKQKTAQQKSASPRKATDSRNTVASSNKTVRPGVPPRVASKAKPQPVSIRVGTMSQRMPGNVSSINPMGQDTLAGEPKRPGLVKKASNASIQSLTSTTNFKSSVSAQPAKPRALAAAERKREQDEREAQRKLEQKREIERRKAAQQEETRRQEQEQRAELERRERERIAAEKAKRQAQQQAIERKRQEAARKAEQQKAEREQAAREASQARPPSRLGQPPAPRPLINHPVPTNPAKPAKRPIEEDNARPQAPKFGAASREADAKRRRTEDEHAEPPTRPTMSGAPIRQSQLGKKPSIFNHTSYQPAPVQSHLNQFPQPPSRAPPPMSQFANTKIPFAEPHAPVPSQQQSLAKTPVSAYQIRTIQAVKSSPHQPAYQNGDNIHLPEIQTDSESEDSDSEGNAFPIPDWATPGHLADQLMRQEGMDGDAVFGPIAPLRIEEIFPKGNKDRLKKLRDRTSSANWAISGDGLTLEEVRHDREQREKMLQEGGWRYGM